MNKKFFRTTKTQLNSGLIKPYVKVELKATSVGKVFSVGTIKHQHADGRVQINRAMSVGGVRAYFPNFTLGPAHDGVSLVQVKHGLKVLKSAEASLKSGDTKRFQANMKIVKQTRKQVQASVKKAQQESKDNQ